MITVYPALLVPLGVTQAVRGVPLVIHVLQGKVRARLGRQVHLTVYHVQQVNTLSLVQDVMRVFSEHTSPMPEVVHV